MASILKGITSIMKNLIYVLFCLVLIHGKPAVAQDSTDAYDPFIDYNEFEIADEEEADINFFRHGRFLTMGFSLGQRSFTEGMSQIYGDDVVYGLYLSYFFDMRFALQFGYIKGSHSIAVRGGSTAATGDLALSGISVDLKYYLNTQNVTKGLGSLNPYFIGGFTSFSREATVDGQPEFAKDSAMGVEVGAGIEIPMMRNKMYFGAQAMYQLVSFKDENSQIILNNGADPTGKYPNGDMFTILGILGVNF
jgi:Outer membrane protein beta-barrel domain